MRLSVPNIPSSILAIASQRNAPSISTPEAVQRIASFLSSGRAAVLTGAGVSVDSGVKAYRGKDGRYMNPDYKPIFYQELIEDSPRGHSFRQRYWLRAYIGFLPVRRTLPNPTHFAIAALQRAGIVGPLITQNVDGLHHAALRHALTETEVDARILELHGSIFKVHCQHGHVYPRAVFQERLGQANPRWHAYLSELERTGSQPRQIPMAMYVVVVLDESVSYDDFVVPDCPDCNAEGRRNRSCALPTCYFMKPDFVFFGETISQVVKDRSYSIVEDADRLFILGTTLATYSAFRLLKHALELRKPVLYLNVGPTRADGLPGVDKLDIRTGTVMTDVVHAGTQARNDPVLRDMLLSGVVKPHVEDEQ
ncbi:DHS-like NAD/FAD-binding domain-containing protein [Multifurca ochricompacta]|uniref:DHS-like NAD/FAD-binding domain-containing protein n=1 Tax=Multifurca ochricompacta TaxID=376703 RepID=A0AAD4QRA5_9AGAM|nr:DHS-like NAD/FAD-binding domain-containing protein [Multifurca ochricompacta]